MDAHADLSDRQWSLNHVIIHLHSLPFRSFGQHAAPANLSPRAGFLKDQGS